MYKTYLYTFLALFILSACGGGGGVTGDVMGEATWTRYHGKGIIAEVAWK